MPKQIHTLNNFSGGINNLKDPRDLSQNELANAVDVMLDKQGVIRTRGGEADYNSTINDRGATISAGYGLAVFESDFGARTYSSTGTAGAESIDFIDKDIIELRSKANEADQFPVGSVISVTGSALNNGFKRIYDTGSDADDSQIKIKPGIVAEANTTATVKRHIIGETLVALADAANGQVDIWEKVKVQVLGQIIYQV